MALTVTSNGTNDDIPEVRNYMSTKISTRVNYEVSLLLISYSSI